MTSANSLRNVWISEYCPRPSQEMLTLHAGNKSCTGSEGDQAPRRRADGFKRLDVAV